MHLQILIKYCSLNILGSRRKEKKPKSSFKAPNIHNRLLYIQWSPVILVQHATREPKELLCMTVVIETIQRALLSIV